MGKIQLGVELVDVFVDAGEQYQTHDEETLDARDFGVLLLFQSFHVLLEDGVFGLELGRTFSELLVLDLHLLDVELLAIARNLSRHPFLSLLVLVLVRSVGFSFSSAVLFCGPILCEMLDRQLNGHQSERLSSTKPHLGPFSLVNPFGLDKLGVIMFFLVFREITVFEELLEVVSMKIRDVDIEQLRCGQYLVFLWQFVLSAEVHVLLQALLGAQVLVFLNEIVHLQLLFSRRHDSVHLYSHVLLVEIRRISYIPSGFPSDTIKPMLLIIYKSLSLGRCGYSQSQLWLLSRNPKRRHALLQGNKKFKIVLLNRILRCSDSVR